MEVRERYTIGISSVLEVVCNKCHKGAKSQKKKPVGPPEEYPVIVEPTMLTVFHEADAKLYRFLDFEANINALVSCFFVGSGPEEIAMTLANLRLKDAAKLEQSYYTYIDRLTVHLWDVADELIWMARENEILVSYKKQLQDSGEDDENTREKLNDVKNNCLTDFVGIDVLYDMGWQKKSSGMRYDSKSGHVFLIGLATNKIIDVVVYCKDCAKCAKAEARGEPPHIHENCPCNYTASSKSMEADGAVKMVSRLFCKYNEKVYVKHFLGDDDSTTRSLLVKKTANNNGKLPDNYPHDIAFWADVNHRVKMMSDKESLCTKGDAL